jgi:hypothetical protein
MQFGEQLWCDERAEFRSHERAECEFFLIGFIHIVEFRTLHDGNRKHLAEYRQRWRNRPWHQRSRYDKTRDDRPRVTADPIWIGIANGNVGINGDPIRDIVFRRYGHATG